MSPFYNPSWRLIVLGLLYIHAALVWVVGFGLGLHCLFVPQYDSCDGREPFPEQVEVIKAAHPIPRGTILMPEMVTKSLVPLKFLPPKPLYEKDLEIYMGMPVSVNVQEGAMFQTSDFTASWGRQAQGVVLGARAGKVSGSAWAAGWR